MTTDRGPSIQELVAPEGICYGCGPANPEGLRLQSYPAEDGEVVADVRIPAKYQNGYGIANGGVVTMLLDCHTGAVITHDLKGYDWGEHPPFLTFRLEVQLRRPSPLETTLVLRGRITERRSTELVVAAEMYGADGKPTATMTAGWRPVLKRL